VSQPGSQKPSIAASLADFDGRRQGLMRTLDGLAHLGREREDTLVADLVDAAARRLREGRFTLVVLGQFKRGKSSLINALLGVDLMPVGVIPLTTVAVTLEHAERESGEVEFAGGERRPIDLGELAEYATERGNPKNHKGVRAIHLRHPAELLAHGVVLVDTPGVGSTLQHNTEATYGFLPEVDVAVLVLSVDPPASESEIAFLRDLQPNVSRIFFVLNKTDLLTDAELAETIEFVRRTLADAAGIEEPRIFPLSARLKDAGFQRFERELERFLVEQSGQFLLQRALERAGAARRQLGVAVDLEERSLSLSQRDLAERTVRLREGLARIHDLRRESEDHLASDVARMIADDLDPALETLKREGIGRLSEAMHEEQARGGPNLRARLEAVVAEEIRALVSSWTPQIERVIVDRLTEIARRYVEEAVSLTARMTELAVELFQTEAASITVPVALDAPSRFTFKLLDQFLGLELVSLGVRRLVPGGLGRQLALRDARRRADELLDRHCGRLRHDLVERVKRYERDLRLQLRAALDATESALLRAVDASEEAHRQGAESVAGKRRALAEQRRRLEEIDLELAGTAAAVGADSGP
jgi:GTP-binding protein EngB required for normal cell division